MLSFTKIAGWCAYLAAAATVISFAALFIFFTRGGIFGTINDAASVFQMIFLLPVAVKLYQLLGHLAPELGLVVTIMALEMMIGIAILKSLVLLGRLRFEETLNAVLIMGGFLGPWWLVIGTLMLRSADFPSALGWTGAAVGASGVLLVLGFWIGGQKHPMAAIGFVINAVAVPIWAIWLGRLILTEGLAISP